MASSNSHYNDSEVSKAKESFTNSKVKEEESHDGYEYESDNSNCSVTSNVKGVLPHYEEPVDACADNTIMQQPADSVDTTWTDEKHSSYLNSIEATFVQKMYDKEYCSLDVCGHSSYSSVNLEQECVESHPFCFNNLQPFEPQQGGRLQYTASSRPYLLPPSVLASPWIQHFKAKQAASVNSPDTREDEIQKSKNHNFPAHGSASNWSSGLSLKKNPAGQFKKIKYQQVLSHMDMEMEERFISKRQANSKCGDVDTNSEALYDQTQNMKNPSEWSKRMNSDDVDESVKENQAMVVGLEMKLTSKSSEGSFTLKKVDQVVPSSEDTGSGEGCGHSVSVVMINSLISNSKGNVPSNAKHSPDVALTKKHTTVGQNRPRTSVESSILIEEESVLGADSTDPNTVCTPSGSKTITWGIQGPRQQLHL